MDKLVSAFEDLIRRSIAPSLSFFVVLALFQIAVAALDPSGTAAPMSDWLGWVRDNIPAEIPQGLAIVAALAILIGVSYALATINQVMFDHFLRGNFDGWFPMRFIKWRWISGSTPTLTVLREQVVARFTKEGAALKSMAADATASDYVMYEVLGGIAPIDTRGFVHDAKSYGMFFSSCVAAAVLTLLAPPWDVPWGWRLFVGGLTVLTSFLAGWALVKAQYRARAIRLYVNFLVMPAEKLEQLLLHARPSPLLASKQSGE